MATSSKGTSNLSGHIGLRPGGAQPVSGGHIEHKPALTWIYGTGVARTMDIQSNQEIECKAIAGMPRQL